MSSTEVIGTKENQTTSENLGNATLCEISQPVYGCSTCSALVEGPTFEHVQANHFPLNTFGQRAALVFVFNVLEKVFEAYECL